MGKLSLTEKELEVLSDFLEKHGQNGLLEALEQYDYSHQTYLLKTKSLIRHIPISTIYYIEILGHDIHIHTSEGSFSKYGTLTKEYAVLRKMGFVKCNQSFLVPVNKIEEIHSNQVILTSGKAFPLSRSCMKEVIYAYMKKE